MTRPGMNLATAEAALGPREAEAVRIIIRDELQKHDNRTLAAVNAALRVSSERRGAAQ